MPTTSQLAARTAQAEKSAARATSAASARAGVVQVADGGTALPTASESLVGRLYYVQPAAGLGTLHICVRDASGNPVWRAVGLT